LKLNTFKPTHSQQISVLENISAVFSCSFIAFLYQILFKQTKWKNKRKTLKIGNLIAFEKQWHETVQNRDEQKDVIGDEPRRFEQPLFAYQVTLFEKRSFLINVHSNSSSTLLTLTKTSTTSKAKQHKSIDSKMPHANSYLLRNEAGIEISLVMLNEEGLSKKANINKINRFKYKILFLRQKF